MFHEGVFQNLAFCARVVRITGKGLPRSTQNGSPGSQMAPRIHSKWVPEGPPATSKARFRKKVLYPPLNVPPEAPKRHPKWNPKSQKVGPGCVFYRSEKTSNFRKIFFSIFFDSGEGRTSKIVPKHCRVQQNQGVPLSRKKFKLFRKRPQK